MAHIMIVDDDHLQQRFFQTALKDQGHEFTLAGNGVECLMALEEAKPDLIIMDLHMPEMMGIEAIKKIRESHSSKALPILVASAFAQGSVYDEIYEVGADAFISKPVDQSKLQRRIDTLLQT